MMPIRDVVIFPFMMTPFVVGRESSVRALEEALAINSGGTPKQAERTFNDMRQDKRCHPRVVLGELAFGSVITVGARIIAFKLANEIDHVTPAEYMESDARQQAGGGAVPAGSRRGGCPGFN